MRQRRIGNESWPTGSMRSWARMRRLPIPFAERRLRLDLAGRHAGPGCRRRTGNALGKQAPLPVKSADRRCR